MKYTSVQRFSSFILARICGTVNCLLSDMIYLVKAHAHVENNGYDDIAAKWQHENYARF